MIDCKSIQPMVARSNAISYDRLHHFIGVGLWDCVPLEATLWKKADELAGGDGAWLIIGDTALSKKGKASVGIPLPIRHSAEQKCELSDTDVGDAGLRRSSLHAVS
nr:transposase [Altericroceibacterium spongiae]